MLEGAGRGGVGRRPVALSQEWVGDRTRLLLLFFATWSVPLLTELESLRRTEGNGLHYVLDQAEFQKGKPLSSCRESFFPFLLGF